MNQVPIATNRHSADKLIQLLLGNAVKRGVAIIPQDVVVTGDKTQIWRIREFKFINTGKEFIQPTRISADKCVD
ncbi:Uncharacterised protein [Vibrio cholerae]|nr:Uncharacterised protein [Vibrio cholerae]CSI39411.1 Uncharacterised protein [Vibrio cholerae]